MIHCWADKLEIVTEEYGIGSDEWAEAIVNGSTCLLEDGHPGPHEWTPDETIMVTFKE